MILAAGLLGCSIVERAPCREPTAAERVYPFTGAWRTPSGETTICLFQRDPMRVSGSVEGLAATGTVSGEGLLSLSVAGVAETLLVRKLDDTLRVMTGTESGPPFGRRGAHWVRSH